MRQGGAGDRVCLLVPAVPVHLRADVDAPGPVQRPLPPLFHRGLAREGRPAPGQLGQPGLLQLYHLRRSHTVRHITLPVCQVKLMYNCPGSD